MRTRYTLARSFLVSVVLAFGGTAPAMAAEGRITWTTFDTVFLVVIVLAMVRERLKRKEAKPEAPREEPATPPHVWVARLVVVALLVWAVVALG